ncbi:hypothetical protein PENTCL1PPCAC_8630 [Pristionchus entomophagus]|uniref:G protein-coupled receptor n=1 Tax=Pristionchus entomophagus TaxID=358040 RepID=A0AAV5SUT9_9BILA|nr:hypothetical protein PENTCL1PPCAC_8630 [Pristionchus entomophagus]
MNVVSGLSLQIHEVIKTIRHILGVACDIVLQLIWDPLMLLPATCILRENPFLRIPGRANQYYETWALTICLNIPVFSACFLERHQAVQSPGSRWLLPMMARHLFIAAILLATIANNFLLRVAQMSSDIQQALLQVIWSLN